MALADSKNLNLSQRSPISTSVWADLARENYTPSQLRTGQLGSNSSDHLVFSDPFSGSSDYLQSILLLTGRVGANATTTIKFSADRGTTSGAPAIEYGTTNGAAAGDPQLYPWSPNW